MAGDLQPPPAATLGLSEMTGAIMDQLRAELPAMIGEALRDQLPALTEQFASRQELDALVTRLNGENTALRTDLGTTKEELAMLKGQVGAMQKSIGDNAIAIDGLRRFFETAVVTLQSNVTTIQQAVQSSVQTLTQTVQSLGDRINAQTTRHDALEKRTSAAEDRIDTADQRINTIKEHGEDLRTRMEPVRTYIFGGDGHKGMPETFRTQDVKIDAVLAMIEPISKKFVELERREEAQRQRIEMAKNIAKSALKNPGAWLAGLLGGTPLTVVVAAMADNPAAKEILVLIQTLLGGN